MRLNILLIGKTKQDFIRDGMLYYQKRIRPFTKLNILELDHPKSKKTKDVNAQKRLEGELILKQLNPTDFVILMDEKGNALDSTQLARYLESKIIDEGKHVVLVIGGAFGFDTRVRNRANALLALSKMTFSHQLVRLVLLEQVYRSFCIVNGHPYHHQ